MQKAELTLETLIRDRGREMDLTVLSGHAKLERTINSPELNRPGLALAGFYEVFAHDRMQILGNTEMSFLYSMELGERASRLHNVLRFQMPCIVVTNGNEVSDDIIQVVDSHEIPLLRTSLPTTRLLSMLNNFLEHHFAPVTNVHGDLLDVFGMGVLIMGSSGVGKSECALELIERGHRLVADDQVMIRRLSKEELVGRSNDVLRYHMEVRGLGILNIEMLFGIAAVLEEKPVELVVWLEKWNDLVEYERLGIDETTHNIFDVRVPKYVVPVQPGRNISIMVEMAALTQRLKNSGLNPAQMMEDSIMARMSGAALPRVPKVTR
ncbi:MAG: HPr(Ser) kinase/phosphatase [Candidatus Sumerlaeaceae bacterium]